jgi:hypothetical protein
VREVKGVFSSRKFLALATVALFVCICQLVSNHGLIRLKVCLVVFYQTVISFFVQTVDVTRNLKNF